jgi:uncharacterized protein YjbJ (UPF0337 family)
MSPHDRHTDCDSSILRPLTLFNIVVGENNGGWRPNGDSIGELTEMITEQQLQGHWTDICGQLKERWGELSDNDLAQFNGNAEQLVGVIQQRTGEARSHIEDYLEQLIADGSSKLDRAAETLRGYAEQAADKMQQTYQQAQHAVQSGRVEAQELVRRHPFESVAVAFGAGLISGVIVGMLTRSK